MKNGTITTNDNDFNSLIMRIAIALNCSVEDIYNKSLEDIDQNCELIELWNSIINAQDRKKILSYMRTIATHIPPVKAA